MERHGSVIKLRLERRNEYLKLHQEVWPEVQRTITACNIRNYTIFYRDGWLFSYFEYVGDDYAGDMDKMAQDPATQKWWDLCKPCQEPLAHRAPGEWWAEMDEAFHQD